MTLFQLIGVGLGGAVTALLVKQINPAFAVYVSVITSVILTFFALQYFLPIITYAKELSSKNGIGSYAVIILRVTAIGVITRIACDICTDAGENTISKGIELLGKGAIAMSVLPVIKNIIEAAGNFLM